MALERVLQYCIERGIDPRDSRAWAVLVEELLAELETLRRIRHLALSYREAEIALTGGIDDDLLKRRKHRCIELDALLGIEEDYRGVM